jgi:pseudouridine-5'-phosphate glycosidase
VSSIEVHSEVEAALADGRPVVGLETAVISAGLPTVPLGRDPRADAPGWEADGPVHVEAARLLPRIVRDAGAVPAVVAVVEGVLRIGLDDAGLARLIETGAGCKASARDLASAMAGGRSAGTTVSATLLACQRCPAGPIRTLATGGIGGVHRGWVDQPDVSGDLRQLAISPACVVASGVKSVLDVGATLEALEALGIPVVAFGTSRFPGFYARSIGGLSAPARVEDAAQAAAVCRTHWGPLGCSTGVLLANPVPDGLGLGVAEIEPLVAEAEAEARGRGIDAGKRTPFVLDFIASRTDGRAVEANIALLASNARLAAMVAAALAESGR